MILLRLVSKSIDVFMDENFNRMTRSHDSLGMNATSEFFLPTANVPLSGDRKDLNEIDSRIRTERLSGSMRMHSIVFVFVLGTRAKVDAGEISGLPSGCEKRS